MLLKPLYVFQISLSHPLVPVLEASLLPCLNALCAPPSFPTERVGQMLLWERLFLLSSPEYFPYQNMCSVLFCPTSQRWIDWQHSLEKTGRLWVPLLTALHYSSGLWPSTCLCLQFLIGCLLNQTFPSCYCPILQTVSFSWLMQSLEHVSTSKSLTYWLFPQLDKELNFLIFFWLAQKNNCLSGSFLSTTETFSV